MTTLFLHASEWRTRCTAALHTRILVFDRAKFSGGLFTYLMVLHGLVSCSVLVSVKSVYFFAHH